MEHDLIPDADDPRRLRHVKLDPYLPGKGPEYELITWDTNTRAHTGQHRIGYAFGRLGEASPIFIGEDCGVAPGDPIDSDAALRGLLGFLTLRPGDTDSEYFESYTAEQLAFADSEAETLSVYAMEESDDPPAFENLDGWAS